LRHDRDFDSKICVQFFERQIAPVSQRERHANKNDKHEGRPSAYD
jgi:hypothetical protein